MSFKSRDKLRGLWIVLLVLTLLSCKTIQDVRVTLPTSEADQPPALANTPTSADVDSGPGEPGRWLNATVTPGVGMNQRFQPLGQIGGNSHAVAVMDKYILIGSGPRLLVVNKDGDAGLKLVGKSEPQAGVVRGIAVHPPYAYLATGRGHLRVLDLSEPTVPRIIGALEAFQWAMAVVVEEERLYVADNAQGLWIADLSNPSQPALLGSVELKQPAAALAVKDHFVYVVHMSGGLVIVDATDPMNPHLIAELSLPQMSSGIGLVRNYALIAAGMGGLWVVDISDPTAPRKIGEVKTSWADGIALENEYAYLTDAIEGLMIFEVSKPEAPRLVAQLGLTIFSQQVPGQRQIALQNGQIIIANPNQGFLLVNASPPDKPTLITSFDCPLSGVAFDVEPAGGTTYVTRDFIGLGSVSSRDPNNLRMLASEISFVKGAPVRTSWKFAVRGDFAYLVDVNMGFRVLNLDSFQQVSGITEPRSWRSISLHGALAYATTTEHDPKGGDPEARRSLRVIDITNPLQPRQIGLLKMKNNTQGIAIKDQILYYPDSLEIKQQAEGDHAALHLIDITDPTNPAQISEVDITGHCNEVSSIVVAGNYAFLGDRKAGICVMDISDPANPRMVSRWEESLTVYDMAMVGERIFVAGYAWVVAINISHPLELVMEDFTVTPGLAWGIAAQNDLVYVADMDGGLNILRYR